MLTEERRVEHQYLLSLELENVRGFEHLKLDFGTADKPRMLTVIVGRNGTGKSTLLRSVVFGSCTKEAKPSLDIFGWVRTGHERAKIACQLERTYRSVSPAADWVWPRITASSGSGGNFEIFLCAYGANRGRGELGGSSRPVEFSSVDSTATLFKYEIGLASSELTLRRLGDFRDEQFFDLLIERLKASLDIAGHRIELPRGGGILIAEPGASQAIPLEAWADGYRMTFSWLIDFFGWAMRADAFDADGEINGILLIDEIEQHMHPSMQAGILGHLRKALPKVQLIVTTHSPLVALSAMPEEIVALHREGDRVVRKEVSNLAGYSYEDALVDKALFGVDPFAPATRHKLDQLHQLQRSPPLMRSADVNDELRSLAVEMSLGRPTSLRADPVLEELAEIKNLLKARAAGK